MSLCTSFAITFARHQRQKTYDHVYQLPRALERIMDFDVFMYKRAFIDIADAETPTRSLYIFRCEYVQAMVISMYSALSTLYALQT